MNLLCEVAARIGGLRKKNIVTSRRWAARPFPLHEAEAAVVGKRHRGSGKRAPVHVKCEPKDGDGVAHQQLPSNSAISFEARFR